MINIKGYGRPKIVEGVNIGSRTTINNGQAVEWADFQGNLVTIPHNVDIQGELSVDRTAYLPVIMGDEHGVNIKTSLDVYDEALFEDEVVMNMDLSVDGDVDIENDLNVVGDSTFWRTRADLMNVGTTQINKSNIMTKKAYIDTITSYLNNIVSMHSDVSSYNFQSGLNGWKITESGHAEFLDVIVNGSLDVFELVFNQMRTTNGTLLVTDSAQMLAIQQISPEHAPNAYVIFVSETPPFVEDDYLMVQYRWGAEEGQGLHICKAIFEVSSVHSEGTDAGDNYVVCTMIYNGGLGTDWMSYAKGECVARVGNETDEERRIYIKLTPYKGGYIDFVKTSAQPVDAMQNFTSYTTTRIGYLAGITHNGRALDGYGIYSLNAYFTGDMQNADQTWHLSYDGSGNLANGSIRWDKDGNTTIEGLDEIELRIKNGLSNTGIDITTYNITLDATKTTVTGNLVGAFSQASNNAAWLLNADGTGQLAYNNIEWDTQGNTTIRGVLKPRLLYSDITKTNGQLDPANTSQSNFIDVTGTDLDPIEVTLPNPCTYYGLEYEFDCVGWTRSVMPGVINGNTTYNGIRYRLDSSSAVTTSITLNRGWIRMKAMRNATASYEWIILQHNAQIYDADYHLVIDDFSSNANIDSVAYVTVGFPQQEVMSELDYKDLPVKDVNKFYFTYED